MLVPREGGNARVDHGVDETGILKKIEHRYSAKREACGSEYCKTLLFQTEWQQTNFWCQAFFSNRLGAYLALVARHEEIPELTSIA